MFSLGQRIPRSRQACSHAESRLCSSSCFASQVRTSRRRWVRRIRGLRDGHFWPLVDSPGSRVFSLGSRFGAIWAVTRTSVEVVDMRKLSAYAAEELIFACASARVPANENRL